MSLYQPGATSSGKKRTVAARALMLWVVIQTPSGFAQDPPSPDEPSEKEGNVAPQAEPDGDALDAEGSESVAALRFDEGVHAGLREGHVSLTWGPDVSEGDGDEGDDDAEQWAKDAGIEEYRVTDETGSVYYVGEFTRAFVSGLPDGIHTFTVVGLDADGGVVASSVEPAVITVNHWPLSYAWASFFVGLVVVASLVSVIVAGAVSSRDATPASGDDAKPAAGGNE